MGCGATDDEADRVGKGDPTEYLSTADRPAGEFSVSVGDPPSTSNARLVKLLAVTASIPVRAEVFIDDENGHQRDVSPPHSGTDFSAPLVGFRPAREYTVDVVLKSVDDGSVVYEQQVLTTSPDPPSPFPDTLLANSQPGFEPGDTLFPVRNPRSDGLARTTFLALVDEAGEIVWAMQSEGIWRDVRLLSDGTLLGMEDDKVVLTDWADVSRQVYEPADDLISYHHEVIARPGGGFFALASNSTTVADFPANEFACEPNGSQVVYDSLIVEVDLSGTEIGRWAMADLFDTQRVSSDSFNNIPTYGLDWVHANGLDYIEETDQFVVSLRHQDALLWVDRTWGTLDRILGNEHGWQDDFFSLRLDPGQTVQWPFHQHAPEVSWNGAEQSVLVFDNGNSQTTPCGGPSGFPIQSRIVEYAVDMQGNQVEQLWEFRYGPPLYSSKMGDADRLETTGHIMGVWGSTDVDVDGTPYEALGYGNSAGRIVEVDPKTDEVMWDLLVYEADRDETANGWEVPRAQRIGSVWPEGAE